MIPEPCRCRKCGEKPVVQFMYRIGDDAELYRVRCEKCQNTGKTEPTYNLSVLSWNDENGKEDAVIYEGIY